MNRKNRSWFRRFILLLFATLLIGIVPNWSFCSRVVNNLLENSIGNYGKSISQDTNERYLASNSALKQAESEKREIEKRILEGQKIESFDIEQLVELNQEINTLTPLVRRYDKMVRDLKKNHGNPEITAEYYRKKAREATVKEIK